MNCCVFNKDIVAIMRLATVSATVRIPIADRTLIYVVQITINLFVFNIVQTILHTIFSLHLAWRGCVLNYLNK